MLKFGLTGSGGRESALAAAISRDPNVTGIVAIPGNDLMHLNLREGVTLERVPIPLAAENARKMAEAFREKCVAIVEVCQDDMVAGGTVNELLAIGIPVVGPTKEAGRIESDKIWARERKAEWGVSQPEFHAFHDVQSGIAFIHQHPDRQWVIKTAGLALGKGVEVTSNVEEAIAAIQKLQKYGPSYLIEERLFGEEFSFFVVCDGVNYKLIDGAQDHKRLLDGDKGPNTGGMGAVSKALILTPQILAQIDDNVGKILRGLRDIGCRYKGVMYFGGIVCNGKVYDLEDNARWGDPEAEVILPGLKTNHLSMSWAVLEGKIDKLDIMTDTKVRVAVALAARGYPDQPEKGKEIFGIDDARKRPGVIVYPAGVKRENGHDFTNGGRVLYVVGEGGNVIEARKVAYEAMNCITVEDGAGQFRKDIGQRDVDRLSKA